MTLGKLGAAYLHKICVETNSNSVFFASGTTIESVVSHIDFDLECLTLVTDNLTVSQLLIRDPKNSVIMIGGQLILPSLNLVGHVAEKMISSFSYDYAFIGAAAIDENGYVYTYNFIEAGTFSAIVASSHHVVVVADSTKINSKTFVQLFQLQKGHVLITNKDVPSSFKDTLETKGVVVITD
jgi:DeoR/GlpR family transcriptional regulator of sugar metabolism